MAAWHDGADWALPLSPSLPITNVSVSRYSVAGSRGPELVFFLFSFFAASTGLVGPPALRLPSWTHVPPANPCSCSAPHELPSSSARTAVHDGTPQPRVTDQTQRWPRRRTPYTSTAHTRPPVAGLTPACGSGSVRGLGGLPAAGRPTRTASCCTRGCAARTSAVSSSPPPPSLASPPSGNSSPPPLPGTTHAVSCPLDVDPPSRHTA